MAPRLLKEFLTLLEACRHPGVRPLVDDFYTSSHAACLVKDETLYDRFDQAFGSYFKGVTEIPASSSNCRGGCAR